MGSLRYLNKYFVKYKYRLILGVLFVVLSNIFSLFPAKYIGDAFRIIEEMVDFSQTNEITANFNNDLLKIVMLIFFTVCVKGVFMFLMRQTVIVVSRNIEYDLKNEIYNHYQSLPISFFKNNRTGDVLNRISEDVSKVRMYLGPAILYSLNLIFLLTFVIFRMLFISSELTFWVLIPLPILSFLIYKISAAINLNSELVQIKLAALTNLTQQFLRSIKIIKSSNSERQSLNQFDSSSRDYMKSQLRLVKINSLFFPLMILLVGMSTLLTIWAGEKLVRFGEIDIGVIAEFIIYVNMLTWPVTSIGWVTSIVQTAAASQKRINEFLSEKNNILSKKSIRRKIVGDISFQNVSFKYKKQLALDNINFNIKNGDFLGVIGSVGSGKTTILQLICRFLNVENGKIFIDNEPIENYDVHYLRNFVSYVPQESFLFSDTIRNNLLFGKTSASDLELLDVIESVCMDHDISKFEHGLETHIGERGVTLSGGQKQRLNIARALLKKSSILLIDDSLSNIDVDNEKKILSNIYSLKGKKTTIIVSNRVSAISKCDQILVLENGSIIEKGNHNDLLKLNGYYKKVYDLQKISF